MWVDGFERIDLGPDGGAFTSKHLPWKMCLHTWEGDNLNGVLRVLAKNPPHFVISRKHRRKIQCVSLDRSSYALRNMPGGVETNRLPVIQLEIDGYAKDFPNLSDGDIQWLGAEVIGPICRARGIPIQTKVLFRGNQAYGVGAWQRLTFYEWARYEGILGHQHVPENSHWDPGALPIDRILAAARGDQEDDMTARLLWGPAGSLDADTLFVWDGAFTIRSLAHRSNADELIRQWSYLGAKGPFTASNPFFNSLKRAS